MSEENGTPKLRALEKHAIIECFREIYKTIGFRTFEGAAKEIANAIKDVSYNNVLNCLKGKPVGEPTLGPVCREVANILDNFTDKLRNHFSSDREDSYKYIIVLIDRFKSTSNHNSNKDKISYSDNFYGRVFENWRIESRKGSGLLTSGAYQLLRRYKPFSVSSDPRDHAIIIEMLYVNAEKLECILITSEDKLYYGTAFINHADIMNIILQRKSNKGVHHRFLSQKLEHRKLPLYSGLSLKAGDTTGRPVASECLYIPVEEKDHTDLYNALKELENSPNKMSSINKDSIISNYIARNPPAETVDSNNVAWSRVKFLKDFVPLANLEADAGTVRFREPIRTIRGESILGVSYLRIPVFQWQ